MNWLGILLFLFEISLVSAHVPVVVIDPGHGGAAHGCEGYYGVYEKTVTLSIALKVKADLESKGVSVVMTRWGDWDLPLYQRSAVANTVHADCFVSIHCNASPSVEPEGIETYTYGNGANEYEPDQMEPRDILYQAPGMGTQEALKKFGLAMESHVLALSIQNSLVKGLKGRKDRGVRQARYAVLHYNQSPAVVAEVGFLTNGGQEGKLLLQQGYQDRIARLLTAGIIRFLRLKAQGAYRYLMLRRLRSNTTTGPRLRPAGPR